LFLEAVFGTGEKCDTLKKAGWRVECFADHFRGEDGKIKDGVKDPEIIKFCAKSQWLLITTDKAMRETHVETIKETEIAIIATASNQTALDVWIKALIKSKAKIERAFKKHPRPWFATITPSGDLKISQITEELFTRRQRHKEGQETKQPD
jgi:hypothetical protein